MTSLTVWIKGIRLYRSSGKGSMLHKTKESEHPPEADGIFPAALACGSRANQAYDGCCSLQQPLIRQARCEDACISIFLLSTCIDQTKVSGCIIRPCSTLFRILHLLISSQLLFTLNNYAYCKPIDSYVISIPVFQTPIPIKILYFSILCFTPLFLFYSCVFSRSCVLHPSVPNRP